MSPNLPHFSPQRRQVALAGVSAAIVVLGAAIWVAPSLASSGPAGEPSSASTSFAVVGSGDLPTARPSLRSGQAPLSVAERGYAVTLAQRAMPTDAVDVLGNPGGEVLLVDRPTNPDATDRLVSVALFDYTRRQTTQLMVNLTSDRVVEQRTSRVVQLPPSTAEVAVALQLALDATPAPGFLTEYRTLTGAGLRAPEQVEVSGGIWLQAGNASADVASACRTERCLQLLVALPSGQYLDTHDFAVNLSTRTVVRAEGNDHHEH